MGVLGLTTFIANDVEKYLKPAVLKDCTLIIDGNSTAAQLFKWRTKRDSAFGGDYDEYWLIVQTFFKHLKKCKIRPIVLMDGGYEERKLPTVYQRAKQKIMTLKNVLNAGFSDIKFFPFFMQHVFCEAVKNLKIQIIQCEFEADGEIAALGRMLRCPILSLDSDFFLYDVLYVPFSRLDNEPVEEDGSFVLKCYMYDVEHFLGSFPGLKKEHFPLVAVLLGNDFNDGGIYQTFFLQGPLRDFKKKTVIETRILGILHWLSSVSAEAAVEKVNEFLDKGERKDFHNALVAARANYSYLGKCGVEVSDGLVTVHPPRFVTPFHPHIRSLLTSLNLPPFLITLASLRVYIPTLLVENINGNSCHLTSMGLVDAIDKLLYPRTGEKSAPHIYLRRQSSLVDFHGSHTFDNGNNQSYESLMNEPLEARRDYLLDTLMFNAYDKKLIEGIKPESQLFLAAFMFWFSSVQLSHEHAFALVTCYIACQAKHKVGYFRVGKDSTLPPKEVSAFVGLFAPYRKTKTPESYNTENVHQFSRFQSILYYASVLNAMLGYPYPACKIAESFAGTLAYNLFAKENRNEFSKSFHDFLQTAPAVNEVYTSLMHALALDIPASSQKKIKKKRREREVKAKPVKKVVKTNPKNWRKERTQEDGEEDVDDVVYNDLSNKFHCLQTGDAE